MINTNHIDYLNIDPTQLYSARNAKSTADDYNYKDSNQFKEIKDIMKTIEKISLQGGYSIRWLPKYNHSEELIKLLTRLGYGVYNVDAFKGCIEINWR